MLSEHGCSDQFSYETRFIVSHCAIFPYNINPILIIGE